MEGVCYVCGKKIIGQTYGKYLCSFTCVDQLHTNHLLNFAKMQQIDNDPYENMPPLISQCPGPE